jgi:hypothetical protein
MKLILHFLGAFACAMSAVWAATWAIWYATYEKRVATPLLPISSQIVMGIFWAVVFMACMAGVFFFVETL